MSALYDLQQNRYYFTTLPQFPEVVDHWHQWQVSGHGPWDMMLEWVLYCRQCWECLAEAYLARGSHTSALRTFARVVEVRKYVILVYTFILHFCWLCTNCFPFAVGSWISLLPLPVSSIQEHWRVVATFCEGPSWLTQTGECTTKTETLPLQIYFNSKISSALCISVDSTPSESHFVECHSLHRLGNINQVRGELSEAVARYSAVLALQPNYLPALKGAQSVGY